MEFPLFYKKVWPLSIEPFIKCTNECLEKGEMACSQKQAVRHNTYRKKRKGQLFYG